MAQTNVPSGSALARKEYSAAIFAKTIAAPSFDNNITGPAPKQSDAEAKLKGQTSKDMPIVRVKDLTKGAGDMVSVDAFDIVTGKPIMGDRNAEGRGVKLSSSSMDIKLDNSTFVVDSGGKMSQQRTPIQLRGIAMSSMQGYFPRMFSQAAVIHLSGARGSLQRREWPIPLATDADFADIMVNTVKAPTFNRHLVLNGTGFTKGGQQLGSIASTDLWTLNHIDELALFCTDHVMPLQNVKLGDDPAADDDPIKGILYLTERQWAQISSSSEYKTALQTAWARKSYGTKHPLFSGEPIMKNGILIRKLPAGLGTRFAISESTNIITAANRYTATESAQTVNAGLTAGYAVERAILIGAQALGKVFGNSNGTEAGISWLENKYNFERNLEIAGDTLYGMAKLRFSYDDGAGNIEPTDNGVVVIDTAVKL